MNTSPSIIHIVGVTEVDKLEAECNNLKSVCANYKIDLVVVSNYWCTDCYNYGCPSCTDGFPKTINPSYDRRTWRFVEDEQKVYKNILIIDIQRDFAKDFGFVKKAKENNWFYVIQNNTQATMDLLNKLGIQVRKYK